MRASKYPCPGSLVDAWWEAKGYRPVNGGVAVMATSRHKQCLGVDEALAVLRAEYGDTVTIDRIGTWRSVTKRDAEEFGTEGLWSEEGGGSAWVRVAYPVVPEGWDR